MLPKAAQISSDYIQHGITRTDGGLKLAAYSALLGSSAPRLHVEVRAM